MTESDPEIQRLLDDFRDVAGRVPQFESFASDQEPTLHHYTDAAGLLGILDRKCIRAGNVRYMNDSSELSYVSEVIAKVAKGLDSTAQTEASRTFLRVLRESPLRHQFPDTEVYAACFSEKWDVLSQWRAYANDGAGYAVGLTCSPRFQVISPDPNHAKSIQVAAKLHKVIYAERDHVVRVLPWIGELVRALDGRSFSTPEARDQGVFHALIQVKLYVIPLGVTMKNPGFVEEAEWRLVVSDDASGQLLGHRTQFRPSRFGLSPFVELQEVSGELPLVSLANGPKLNSNEAHGATILLLRKHGRFSRVDHHDKDVPGQVSVRHSKTSYR
jgi:hypothetical protein